MILYDTVLYCVATLFCIWQKPIVKKIFCERPTILDPIEIAVRNIIQQNSVSVDL